MEGRLIGGADRVRIADCHVTERDTEVNKANAALIVHAVNTLDEAKAALQNIDRLAGCQSTNYEDLSLAIGECRTIARAILTDLEG